MGAVLNVPAEMPLGENAGVFCKEAEEYAYQKNFKVVTRVPGLGDLIVEIRHQPGGLDAYLLLFLVIGRRISGDEIEQVDVAVELRQRKFVLLAGLNVIEADAREIRDNDVAGQGRVWEAWKVVLRLSKGFVEVFAARLMLGEKDALP